jgi:hypothetical protein
MSTHAAMPGVMQALESIESKSRLYAATDPLTRKHLLEIGALDDHRTEAYGLLVDALDAAHPGFARRLMAALYPFSPPEHDAPGAASTTTTA